MADYQPRRVATDLAPTLVTFDEMIERVLDAFGLSREPRAERQVIRAINDALSVLPMKHDWKFYEHRYPFATSAPITAGTLSYDAEGDADGDRMVTLSTAIVPANVDKYTLKLTDVHYEIERYVSSTKFQLSRETYPTSDVTSTTYMLYRDGYELPPDFLSGGDLIDVAWRIWPLRHVPVDDVLRLSRGYTTGQPQAYTYRPMPRQLAGTAIYFGPIPSAARNYEFMYRRTPRSLRLRNYSTGTVATTSGSTTVTGTGTAFASSMVGSVMRFSVNASAPTPASGGFGGDNPAIVERIVASVESGTSLTLDSDPGVTLSGVAFTMSDVVDVAPGAMFTYFSRLSEAFYAQLDGRDDAAKRLAIADAYLRDARSSDNAYDAMSKPFYGPRTLADIASNVTP